MKERYEEDLNQKPPESWQRLEAVAFHFTQLYQRLVQDRDNWAVTGGDLADAVKAFEKQLRHLETLDEQLRQQLSHSLENNTRQAVDRLTDSFKQGTQAVLVEEIKGSADDLLKIVQEAKYVLSIYQQEMAHARKWWIGIAFISALSGSMIGGLTLYCLHF